MRWMAIDPGFLNCGWCVGEYRQNAIGQAETIVLAGGCLTQPKAPKKRDVKSAADDFDRAAKLAKKLAALIDEYQPEVLCFESISLPRNSSTAAKLGRAYGVISALAELARLPCIAISPQEMKEAVLGRRKGSKSEIRGRLTKLYGGEAIEVITKGAANQFAEHPIDALGVLHASIETTIFKMGSKMPIEE